MRQPNCNGSMKRNTLRQVIATYVLLFLAGVGICMASPNGASCCGPSSQSKQSAPCHSNQPGESAGIAPCCVKQPALHAMARPAASDDEGFLSTHPPHPTPPVLLSASSLRLEILLADRDASESLSLAHQTWWPDQSNRHLDLQVLLN
jgi:hypothetical protein